MTLYRIPCLGDCIADEPIIHRNSVTVDDVRVVFAATASKKVVISVQSIQNPHFFTVFTNSEQLKQGLWGDEIKAAFVKMPRVYRQHYSVKPEHRPSDAVVIDFYGTKYRVCFRDYDGRQFSTFCCVEKPLYDHDLFHEEQPLFGFVRKDIEMMNLAWPLLSLRVRARYPQIAQEFELERSPTESDSMLDDLSAACERLGIV